MDNQSEQDSTRVSQDTREWVEDILSRVEMVEWDRFVTGDTPDRGFEITVYGWIDREKDSYKDFVILNFYPETDDELVWYTTSSDRYTNEICEAIYGESDDHNDCQRVENTFNLPNAVELGPPTCRECGNELPFAFEDQKSLVCMECVRGEYNAQ